MKKYLNRLIPAVHATAMVAAVVHVVSLGFASGGMGFEAVYIAVLTYIISFVAAIPVGTILLVLVGIFRLGLRLSLLLFLLTAQCAVIAITMYLFEFEFIDIPWQYPLISVPPAFTAWYFSVYHIWKNNQNLRDI